MKTTRSHTPAFLCALGHNPSVCYRTSSVGHIRPYYILWHLINLFPCSSPEDDLSLNLAIAHTLFARNDSFAPEKTICSSCCGIYKSLRIGLILQPGCIQVLFIHQFNRLHSPESNSSIQKGLQSTFR